MPRVSAPPYAVIPLNREEARAAVRVWDAWAWKMAHKFRRRSPRCDLEDLHSEAVMGMYTAAEKYDPTRDASFLTYATYWAENYLRIFARKETARGQHVPAREGLRLVICPSVNRLGHKDGLPVEAQAPYTEQDENLDLWEMIRPRLEPRQFDLLRRRYLHRHKFARIAQDWGISRQRVQQIHETTVAWLREQFPHWEETYLGRPIVACRA